jgi:hypothetical protein
MDCATLEKKHASQKEWIFRHAVWRNSTSTYVCVLIGCLPAIMSSARHSDQLISRMRVHDICICVLGQWPHSFILPVPGEESGMEERRLGIRGDGGHLSAHVCEQVGVLSSTNTW